MPSDDRPCAINFILNLRLLVLEHADQAPNVRQNLHRKDITVTDLLLGFPADADTCWCAGQDHRACGESRSLREKADKLGDGEDEVAGRSYVSR